MSDTHQVKGRDCAKINFVPVGGERTQSLLHSALSGWNWLTWPISALVVSSKIVVGKIGSLRFAGEGGFDLQEKIGRVTDSVGHPFDGLGVAICAFEHG